MLESCGLHAKYGLRVLEQKSLLRTSNDYFSNITTIDMHDHIEEMGKNIADREHLDDPHKRSRLWIQKDIEDILADNTVRKETRCIDLRITPGISLEALGNMRKLTCLIVNNRELMDSYDIDEACIHFPDSLRYLVWYKYPNWRLPKTFEANNLVALEMPHSNIKQLWEGGKVMEKLKFLELSYSKLGSLDLGLTPNLERLNLERCEGLVKLYVHGGCLKSLAYLNLVDCNSLKSISFIEELESLEVLTIGDLNMRKFPDYIFTGHSNNSLLELNFCGNLNIEEIPSSVGNLQNLIFLRLIDCRLKNLPGSIYGLKHLRTLILYKCGIEELAEDLGQLECLEYLNLGFTEVQHLPNSICMLKRLKILGLCDCRSLEKLPEDVGQLESLEELDLDSCSNLREIPSSICNLECLKLLNIRNAGITRLPHNISLLKGLKIDKSEDQILDDDFFQTQGFQQLRTLDLRRHGIEDVPEALGQLECLEELNLSHTNVKRLPDSICMLKSLKNLFLESCVFLEKLPDDVGQLESLEELNLSGCYEIREIPSSICMLKHLKMLNLEGCDGIEELPEALGQLECLEDLNIRDTDVKRLPDSICMLRRLKKLNLRGCLYLEKLPDDVGQLESLEELDLTCCYSIRELPNNIHMLKQLKILDLYHCFCLEKLPDDVGQLESLEELYLNCCYNIREIPSNICMLKHLRTLDLEGCRRLQILPGNFGELESLQLLKIVDTGINHLPESISLLNGLQIIGFVSHTKSTAPFQLVHEPPQTHLFQRAKFMISYAIVSCLSCLLLRQS